MSYKGKYKPKNIAKYKGDASDISYRSLWELKCMKKFDKTESVIQWSSEEIIIPYYCPVRKRWRRYFPDFYVKVQNSKNEIVEYVIEVKPHKETKKPNRPKDGRKYRRFLSESKKFANNASKWEAAKEYCLDRRWVFQIWTEKTMNF
jgi:hypothetical protein